VAEDVTLGSVIDSLKQSGRPRIVPDRTIRGHRVVGVQWRTVVDRVPIVTTLYARSARPQLPVEMRIVNGAPSASIDFSRWNEPIRIAVPRSAVPISPHRPRVAARCA